MVIKTRSAVQKRIYLLLQYTLKEEWSQRLTDEVMRRLKK